MEFSDKLRHGGSGQPAPVAISPDGLVMATTQDLKIELREVDSLRVLQLYTSLDVVQHMVWSPDSKYLACGIYKRGLVQVRRASAGRLTHAPRFLRGALRDRCCAGVECGGAGLEVQNRRGC